MTRDTEVLESMRREWNERAREDANYYAGFGRRGQDDCEFFATAQAVMINMQQDLKRLPANTPLRALEIGCGPGRLMRAASVHFSEIHGVDVSDEMVRLATENLRDIPHAHVHSTSGSDLAAFADNYFDFIYSYAVFQHIPSREVVFAYLSEARRVLKPGGVLWCQLNGLPEQTSNYTTWDGIRIRAYEIADFTRAQDLQLLRLEGASTQYMWITCRKQVQGWGDWLEHTQWRSQARILNIINAESADSATPASGRFAIAALWIRDLPADCDLNHMQVRVDGRATQILFIGPPQWDGITQVNVALPEGIRTGLAPVEVEWMGKPLCDPFWMRILPAGPMVPQVCSLADGLNLLSGARILTGTVKLTMEEVLTPELFHATIDGKPVVGAWFFCTDPWTRRFEFNFELPKSLAPGPHQVEASLGRRRFLPMPIEVG